MKVERNRVGNKYTFTPEDKEDEKFLDKVNKKIDELEEENKKLKEDNNKLQTGPYKYSYIKKLKKQNEKLEEENRKLKDKFMLRLAEIYLLPPTSNQMAEYKKWNYSKWYDEIKNQIRKEIKEEG